MGHMPVLIRADGTETIVLPADGKKFSLDELYTLIECSIVECVYLADDRIMWIDEEGKLKNTNTMNDKATKLLHEAGGMPYDYIVGNALIVPNDYIGQAKATILLVGPSVTMSL